MNKFFLCLLACFSLNAIETAKLTLDNGLKIYIISDPNAEKSAAALSVNAGSWDDPDEHSGIAHFLEHMLFLGTKTHPVEDGFFDFIKRHGGQSNAFTEDLYTTYIFDINSTYFPDALSYLSEFLYEPLLTPSGSEREIEAITQEFHGHSQGDAARRLQVYKTLGDQSHPFTHFNYGNKESLKNTSAVDLKIWMENHYSSDKMLLTIYSSLSIEELERISKKDFSKIPKRVLRDRVLPPSFLSAKTKEKILLIDPLTQKRSLAFLWQLPSKFAKALDSRPEEIICAIFGHEGEGTLLDHLKEAGLAYELGCGSYRWSNEQMAFIIEAELTELGVQKYKEVISIIFSYLKQLKNQPLPPSIFEELQKVQKIKAAYPKRETSYKEVIQKSRELRLESLETYPLKTDVIQTYDPKLVKELWNSLTVEDARIDLMAPADELNTNLEQKERWMHVPFHIQPLGSIEIKPLPTARFPERNSFISEDFSLVISEDTSVQELVNSEYGKLYLAHDNRYRTPKSSIIFKIQSPQLYYNSAKNVVRTDLWIKLIESMLTRSFYSAKQAGLEYKITYDNRGLFITVTGFSDKVPQLFEEVLTKLKNFKWTEPTFKKQAKRLEASYRSQLKKVPYEQAIRLLKESLYKSYPTITEKIKALANLKFQEFSPFSAVSVDALIIGNIEKEAAINLYSKATKLLGTPQKAKWMRSVIPFQDKPRIIEKKIDAKGSGILYTFELTPYSLENEVATKALSQMMSVSFFKELRTKQQTGYVVTNLQESVDEHIFYLFLIQSFTHSPLELQKRIDAFIKEYQPQEKDFIATKRSLIERWSKNPDSFEAYVKEMQSLAFNEDFNFALIEEKVEALQKLTFERFKQITKETLGKENQRRVSFFLEEVNGG